MTRPNPQQMGSLTEPSHHAFDGSFGDTDVDRPLDIGYLGEPRWAGALGAPPPADWQPPVTEPPPAEAPQRAEPDEPADPTDFEVTDPHERMYPWKGTEPIRELPESAALPPSWARTPAERRASRNVAKTRLPASDRPLELALAMLVGLIAVLVTVTLIGVVVEVGSMPVESTLDRGATARVEP